MSTNSNFAGNENNENKKDQQMIPAFTDKRHIEMLSRQDSSFFLSKITKTFTQDQIAEHLPQISPFKNNNVIVIMKDKDQIIVHEDADQKVKIASNARMKCLEKQNNDLTRKLNVMLEENEELKNRLVEMQNSKTKMRHSDSFVKLLDQQHHNDEMLEKAQNELIEKEKCISQHWQNIIDLKEQNTEADVEIKCLRKKLESASNELKERESAIEKKYREQLKRNDELRQKNEELVEEIDKVKSKFEEAKLFSENAQREIFNLKNNQSSQTKLDILMRQHEATVSKNKELILEIEDLRKKLQNKDSEIEKSIAEISRLSATTTTMNNDIEREFHQLKMFSYGTRCPTANCNGMGNVDGRWKTHRSIRSCPNRNANSLVNSASPNQVAEEPSNSISTGSTINNNQFSKCPFPNCNGLGNVNRGYATHRSINSCPNANKF